MVIGTSWGGLHALRAVLRALPAGFRLPVVAVQHRHRDSENLLVGLLQDGCLLPVVEVEDKQPMEPGHVFIAPPDYHVLVDDGHFSLSTDAPVRFSRPSIDVTFMSAADHFGPRSIGVVMTGANDDGARGLKRIADRGGRALVQDPVTAESPIMPLAALREVPTAVRLPLELIGPTLVALTQSTPSTTGDGS